MTEPMRVRPSLLIFPLVAGLLGCAPRSAEQKPAVTSPTQSAKPAVARAVETPETVEPEIAEAEPKPQPATVQRFELTAAQAVAAGLPAVDISLTHHEPFMSPAPDQWVNTFASFSGPPGGQLGLRLTAAHGLPPTAEALTAHAELYTTGEDLEVHGAHELRIAGVDRWVCLAFTKTHRGHLGTAWVLYPGLAEGEAVVVSAWAEVDPATTTAQTMLDRFGPTFDSLSLRFHQGVVYDAGEGESVRGVVRVGSDGHTVVVSAEGGPDARETLAWPVEMIDGMDILAFKAPPAAGSPRYALGARVYQRSDADFMEGLRLKLSSYSVELARA